MSDCGILIKQIHNQLEKNANNVLRAQGLTMTQIGMLVELDAQPLGKMTMKELEQALRVAQSTVVGIVNRLEQRGYVVTFTDSDDKRVRVAQITEKGMQCCQQARKNMEQAEENLLAGLNGQERETFHKLLEKVIQTMKS